MKTHMATSGKHFDRLYIVWQGIKCRCYTATSSNYERYGAKGIRMEQTWYSSFEVFRDWALLNGYQYGLQIDRINSAGNYEPNNCRFVTAKANSRNRRGTLKFQNNETSSDVAKRLGITRQAVTYRVRVIGMSLEDAAGLPKNMRVKYIGK